MWHAARKASAALFVLMTFSRATNAAPAMHRFEPTDLELEDPGTVEVDLQLAATSGDRTATFRTGAGRLYAPDYEIDVGLSSRLELDFDGAFSLDPMRGGGTKLTASEPFWSSVKVGLLDLRDVGPAHAAAFGLQLGPRLPFGSDLHGVGYELIALANLDFGRAHLVFNAGGLVDPANGSERTRPRAAIGGVDVTVDLDPSKRWSFQGELGGGYFFAGSPHQLATTGGVAYDTGKMQWSLLTLISLQGPSDRVGLLLGLAPRIDVF